MSRSVKVQNIEPINTNLVTLSNHQTAICLILKAFSLERVYKDKFNNIIVKDIKWRCGVKFFITITLVLLTYFFCQNNFFTNPVHILNVYLPFFVWNIQYITCLVLVCLENKYAARKYYKNMEKIDKVLINFQTNYYKRDKMSSYFIFFPLMLTYVIVYACEFYTYDETCGLLSNVFSISSYYLKGTVVMSVLGYAVKLHLYRSRLIALKLKLNELTKGTATIILEGENNYRRHSYEYVTKVLSTYYLLYEQSYLINDRYRYEVALWYTNAIFNTISALYMVTGMAKRDDSFEIPAVPVYLAETILVNMTAVLIIEVIMSIRRHFKKILLTAHKCLVDSNFLNEVERESWREFVSLCHRQPIEFNAAGFFRLDYSLLAGMLGTMITYTIILTQLNEATSNDRV